MKAYIVLTFCDHHQAWFVTFLFQHLNQLIRATASRTITIPELLLKSAKECKVDELEQLLYFRAHLTFIQLTELESQSTQRGLLIDSSSRNQTVLTSCCMLTMNKVLKANQCFVCFHWALEENIHQVHSHL